MTDSTKSNEVNRDWLDKMSDNPPCLDCGKELNWHKYYGGFICYTDECPENGKRKFLVFKDVEDST